MTDYVTRTTPAARISAIAALVIVSLLVAAPWWGSVATERLIGEFMVYLALATLWNLLAGYTGLVSVGQQAFVGFGAYVVFSLALLAGWNPLYAIPIGGIVCAALAVPVARLVFRLQGAYFAIGTWVVAEVFRLGFAQVSALGGGSGKSMPTAVVKLISESKFWREATIYWVALALGVGALVLAYALLRSRVGLALTAIRDNETASMSLGIRIERVKLGGNGPIMANAMAALGTPTTYIGNLGYPHVHPAFSELLERATVISVAEPAYTDALEFNDGKLMLGKRKTMLDVNWANLVERVGRDRLQGLFANSALIGLQNWTMLPAMSDIWQHVLDEICPKLEARHTFFFDLADPESRDPQDIRHALDLIAKFQKHFDTYLGLNEKESFEVAGVLAYKGAREGEVAVQAVAKFVQDKLKIAGVVVHPRAYAVAASKAGVFKVAGPFVEKPLISTGDQYPAGFCLGKLIGADDETALQIGVGNSGYYVRTAKSPAALELAGFLKTL